MSNVSLRFVRGRGIGSRMIEWFGGGARYSHVDIELPDGMLLGARSDKVGGKPPGVQIRPAGYTGSDETLLVVIPCEAQQAQKAIGFARAQIGKGYDHLAIIGFIIGRNWREDDLWICSELAAATLERSGIVHELAVPASRITPGSLLLVVSVLVRFALPLQRRR